MNPVIEVLEGNLQQYHVWLDNIKDELNALDLQRESLENLYQRYLTDYDSIKQHIEELQNANSK